LGGTLLAFRFEGVLQVEDDAISNEARSACLASSPNDLERELQRIWATVLKRSVVGLDDDFFQLGGTSLKGAELICTIEDELNVEIGLEVIFDCSTIRALAANMNAARLPAEPGLAKAGPAPDSNANLWFIQKD
jgi:acyl carrier protein